MAKSIEQKRAEAVIRGKRSYFHKVETFLVLGPALLDARTNEIDFCIWVNHFAAMRRTAKELGIHWTGNNTYSTDESWSTREIIEHWIKNPNSFMDDIEKLVKYLDDLGRYSPRQVDRNGWLERNVAFKQIVELPKNQALLDVLN